MRKPIETLADSLGHPEGPDVLPDGRIVFVETYTSRIGVWERGKGVSTYADCGGGPNACMLGSDGAVYITQNGGTVGEWRATVMGEPSIQKCWPDGRVETVATEIDGIRLQAPNDLTFLPDGRLAFTDPGDYLPNNPSIGRLFILNPDGTGECLEEVGPSYPNGIVSEPDGSLVWVESYRCGVYRKRPGQPSVQIAQLADGHIPDGLKVAANGDLWVTAFTSGGVDILRSDGTFVDTLVTGGVPLNCIFDNGSLVITDFGDVTGVTAEAPMLGRLWRVDVGVEGMPLFRGAVRARS